MANTVCRMAGELGMWDFLLGTSNSAPRVWNGVKDEGLFDLG